MAIPPSESSSSGSRVPWIGTRVSRASAGGTGAPLETFITQQGVSQRVPSQIGSLAAPSRPCGRSPSGSRKRSPSGTTRSAWSWTRSQRPRRRRGRDARLRRGEVAAEAVPVEREVHGQGRRPMGHRGHASSQKTIRPRASTPAARSLKALIRLVDRVAPGDQVVEAQFLSHVRAPRAGESPHGCGRSRRWSRGPRAPGSPGAGWSAAPSPPSPGRR